MRLVDRFHTIRPFDDMEMRIVRMALERRQPLTPYEETVVRTALSLARIYTLGPTEKPVHVGAFLRSFREDVSRRLRSVLLEPSEPRREFLLHHIGPLHELTNETLSKLKTHLRDRINPAAIDREVRHKSLVLVLGGGGGTAYVHIGAMALLDTYGIVPSLMLGTSLGAILALFRARGPKFEQDDMLNIVRDLTWQKMFRAVSTENRYGLPAALRLYLRSGLGRWFGVDTHGGTSLRLSQLPIKTIIAVGGIRRGQLPKPPEFYETLISRSPTQLLNPMIVPKWFNAIFELAARQDILAKLYFGSTPGTIEIDALDAAGFSSSLPGVVHYDVLRDDPRAHELLQGVLETHGVSRFIDGGIIDNLPAKAAWRAVHAGAIETRNVFVLALNSFARKFLPPTWLPLEQLADFNVRPNRRWAHLVVDFSRTLSPLAVVPSVRELIQAITLGKEQVADHMELVARMLAPLPPLP